MDGLLGGGVGGRGGVLSDGEQYDVLEFFTIDHAVLDGPHNGVDLLILKGEILIRGSGFSSGGGALGPDFPSGVGASPISFGEATGAIKIPPSDGVAGAVPTNSHGLGFGPG